MKFTIHALAALLCFLSVDISLGQSFTGVTAAGKLFSSAPGEKPPWAKDLIYRVAPAYPYAAMIRNDQGEGRFVAQLDPKTGRVINASVKRSTGYSSLDDAVITALRSWRFKPGKWKSIELPVKFQMSRDRDAAMEKMRRLRAQGKVW